MTQFPKWLLFLVSIAALMAIIGGAADGIMAPASGYQTQVSSLLSGHLLSIGNMVTWHFPWMTGYAEYLAVFITLMFAVFGALLVYEAAKFWRGIG